MRFKNLSFYVQKQIDRILRLYKNFSKTYIDNIEIFFKTKHEHLTHLKKIFNVLIKNNIAINLIKTFIEFSSVILLKQRITSLRLYTDTRKMKVIFNLRFSGTLENLKTYLKFTYWLRRYVFNYAAKSKSLQNRKNYLLKSASKVENVKKFYISKIKLQDSTIDEIVSFNYIQRYLSNKRYFVYFESLRQLYIDLSFSDKDIDAMICYVKSEYVSWLLQRFNLFYLNNRWIQSCF